MEKAKGEAIIEEILEEAVMGENDEAIILEEILKQFLVSHLEELLTEVMGKEIIEVQEEVAEELLEIEEVVPGKIPEEKKIGIDIIAEEILEEDFNKDL